MKDNRRRIRIPILIQISLLFMMALLLSAVVFILANRSNMLNYAMEQGEDKARMVAVAAETAIGTEESIRALMRDEKLREEVHKKFKYICSKADVRCLYLYTVDDDGNKHNIVCAAKDDEEDRKMNEEYGFGFVNEQPLYSAEIDVLNGDMDGESEFINNEFGNVYMFVLPVIDGDGRTLALIGVDYSVDSIIKIEHEEIRFLLINIFVVVAIAFVISLLLIRRLVIRRMLVLSERMRNFVKNRDDNTVADKKTPNVENEITDIEASFDKMAKDISGYVDDIRTLAQEKAQSLAQLDIASKIQLGMVPQEYIRRGTGYEAYGCESPAKEVGGDFYDIFRPDDDHICVIVGDISGKGIYAALFMAIVRTAIIERIKSGESPEDTLNRVNKDICVRNPENMFATVFVMMLNKKTGSLTYANAGHEAPLLLGREQSFLKMGNGTALGLFGDSKVFTDKISLRDGEGILIYTDGITETINGENVQYGRKGLIKTVGDVYTSCGESYHSDKIVQSVVDSVREYAEGLEQFDDITCVAIVYNEDHERKISTDISSFDTVKQAIISSLGDNDDSKRAILACEEIFSNIINYSGADDVDFSCRIMGNVFSVTFSDNGTPFDPAETEIRDRKFEDLDSGGMGIKLARMNSNEMVYIRLKNRNVITLKFDIRQFV